MKYAKEFVKGVAGALVHLGYMTTIAAFFGVGLAYGAIVGLNIYARLHGA